MTFGTIDLHPGGDSIVIAAESGQAVAAGSRSFVHNGRSGMIVLQSASGTYEQVDIQYPDQVILACGGQQIILGGVATHSQFSSVPIDLPADRRRIEVSMGGELVLAGDEKPCRYSGVIPIELHYH